MNKNIIFFLAFFCGLGSSLFVSTPFGRVAIFDLFSYFLGPVLFLYNHRRFTRSENRLLFLAFLWFLGACYSNWWREEDFSIALKGNAIVFNVTCMLIVGIVIVKKSYRTFLWFSMGYGIAEVMSLYVFQNGAYLSFAEEAGYGGWGGMQEFLAEKQIYPIYAQAMLLSVLFPLRSMGLIPWGGVGIGCIATAFFLLFEGGSRGGFGSYIITGMIVLGYAYFRPLVRMMMRNFILLTVVGGIMIVCIFGAYAKLALTGKLGEAEYNKYMLEREISEAGYLGSRDDLVRAWPFLKNHPFVGCGSSALDRWGYMEDGFLIPSHSALVGAWTQNGLFGLLFWLYSIFTIVNFMRKRMILFGEWFPFLAYQMVSLTWDILFSPFGWYRGYACMVIALCCASSSPNVMQQVTYELLINSRRFGKRTQRSLML